MGSTSDANICFEGTLDKVTKTGNNTQSLWCTLDGVSLAFYRNKRSSCMFTIEISRIKDVTPLLDKKQFEVVTEKKYLFASQSKELCEDWINHIEEARQQGGALVLTSHPKLENPDSPRRGSLPQRNTVSDALKRLSSKSDEKHEITSDDHEKKMERTSSTKDMIKRFSMENTTKESTTSFQKFSRPKSGEKVSSLSLRFSGEVKSLTSPISPPKSPVKPSSPQSTDRSALPNSSSGSVVTPSLVHDKDINQENDKGISITNFGTKIDLSEVSPNVIKHLPTTDVPVRDSGYTSEVSTKEPQDEVTLREKNPTTESNGIEDEGAEPVVYRRPSYKPSVTENGEHLDEPEQINVKSDDDDDEKEEEEEEGEEEELDSPDLQLLDELMNLTFDEVTELPDSPPVDLTYLMELKGLLTDVPTSVLMRRSIDLNNNTPVEELKQFLETAD